MNTNIELKNHLQFEFKVHNSLFAIPLNEARSVVDGIDNVVNIFLNMAYDQIKHTFSKFNTENEITSYYNETNKIWKNSNIKTFFNKFNLKLTIKKANVNRQDGGADTNSITEIGKNTFDCKPDITLIISATDAVNANNGLGIAIGHELTHCYNLLQYAIKNGKYDTSVIFDKNKYKNIDDVFHNPGPNNLKAIGTMLYNLTRVERNAYIAQLRQELLAKKDLLKDASSLFDVIKTTNSYKKFLLLEDNVNAILSATNKQVQDQLISYLNHIMESNFTTFNQFKKYFVRRWTKWKKAYIIKASKIAYDVFEETHQMLDNGDLNQTFKINPNN